MPASKRALDFSNVDAPKSPRPKIYSRHNCSRTHRTYNAWAHCCWSRAYSIVGEGRYAFITMCRNNERHVTLSNDLSGLTPMLGWTCGGACRGYDQAPELPHTGWTEGADGVWREALSVLTIDELPSAPFVVPATHRLVRISLTGGTR